MVDTTAEDMRITPKWLVEEGEKLGEPQLNFHSLVSAEGINKALWPVVALDPM